jgi:hypothetical protein
VPQQPSPRNTTGYWVYVDDRAYAPGSFLPRGTTEVLVWDMMSIHQFQVRAGEADTVQFMITVPLGATPEAIGERMSRLFHYYMVSATRPGGGLCGPSELTPSQQRELGEAMRSP